MRNMLMSEGLLFRERNWSGDLCPGFDRHGNFLWTNAAVMIASFHRNSGAFLLARRARVASVKVLIARSAMALCQDDSTAVR